MDLIVNYENFKSVFNLELDLQQQCHRTQSECAVFIPQQVESNSHDGLKVIKEIC